MSDEQRSRRWLVKVKSCDQVSVLPSESLEIGRKPIRPLPDDGTPRFEVNDETRSMSKRHAVLRVLANGSATLRDMRSTNGTYLVRDDGRLVRLPADVDFPMPSAAVRMQFGDVPVDFVQVEEAAEPEPSVTDLFEYATDDGKPAEPDVADMSVDDILDLRAGEPTSALDASSVEARAKALRAAALQSFTPMVAPVEDPNRPVAIADPVPLHVEQPKREEPRDLFVDALSTASGVSADGIDTPKDEHVSPEPAQNIDEATLPVATRIPVLDTTPLDTFDPHPVEQHSDVAQPAEPEAIPQSETAAQSEPTASADQTQPEQSTQPAVQSDQQSAQPTVGEPSEPETTAAYTPVFEPGSVFDRVAKGEFRKPEPTVEIDGLTSDEAKHTTDFTVQFSMAAHRQLLPFLAMNPSLYDDLYAWLSARGDADIDAALADNPGYQEYRHAVGK
ncbi:FHA domain-containing protein [Bifidobacterium sp. SO1]|uniref:variant leucine-rich repeat-containing protein n=1 Tax=Bifidobacterium sp. SO1 TaxID=2809029 RepID=UPI0032049C35